MPLPAATPAALLLERAVPDKDPSFAPGAAGQSAVLVSKRYRDEGHRSFHRSGACTEGRRVQNTRDVRAMAGKIGYGRQVAAGQWAWAEWLALTRFWILRLAVPYPVQVDGTELLMEWITVEGRHGPETAPRLAQAQAQARPSPRLLAS